MNRMPCNFNPLRVLAGVRRGASSARARAVIAAVGVVVAGGTAGAWAAPAVPASGGSVGPSAPSWVPHALRARSLVGVALWQWVALVALVFVGVALDFLLRTIARRPLDRIVARTGAAVPETLLRRTTRALGPFGAAVFWTATLRVLAFEGRLGQVAITAVGVFTVFAGVRFLYRLTDVIGALLMHVAKRTESKFDDIIVPLLRKTAKVVVVALGVVYGAQTLSIDIVPLITGLGIGGLAFAFAAKDTVENFFGSIAVVLDRPFEVGDWVVVEGVEGIVEELGLRSTRIRTFYNSQVSVPNSILVRARVDNYGRRRYRRWKTTLSVQYDTTPEQLLAFTEGIRELIRHHPYTRKDFYQVWCHDFGASSIDILLYLFFEVPDWSTELRERERLLVDIVRLADRLGVQFAFPTRTVHLFTEEHAPPEPHYAVPRDAHDDEARRRGADTARELVAAQPWRDRMPPPVRFEVDGRRVVSRGGGGSDAGE